MKGVLTGDACGRRFAHCWQDKDLIASRQRAYDYVLLMLKNITWDFAVEQKARGNCLF